jgi:hypothetical protein
MMELDSISSERLLCQSIYLKKFIETVLIVMGRRAKGHQRVKWIIFVTEDGREERHTFDDDGMLVMDPESKRIALPTRPLTARLLPMPFPIPLVHTIPLPPPELHLPPRLRGRCHPCSPPTPILEGPSFVGTPPQYPFPMLPSLDPRAPRQHPTA